MVEYDRRHDSVINDRLKIGKRFSGSQMYNNKALTFLSTSLFFSISLFLSAPVQAAGGEQLFQQHCSRCHQTAKRIKTPINQIRSVLTSGTIRAHRFTLDEATIQSIVDYIGQQQS